MRFSLVLVVLLAAPALAGCISASQPVQPLASGTLPILAPSGVWVHGLDGLPASASAIASLPATLGTQLSLGIKSVEPTLGITKEGFLFMTAIVPGANAGAPTVYRSEDHGSTWKDVGPQLPVAGANPPTTLDPYVYVDQETGRVFTDDLDGPCSYLSYSDDKGESWTTSPAACGLPPGPLHDHQSLVAADPHSVPTTGYPHLIYYCINLVYDSSCAVSPDGGLTFGPLVPAYLGVDPNAPATSDGPPFDQLCGGLTGHVKVSNKGLVALPKAHCGVPSVSVTEDDGITWTVHAITTEAGMRSQSHEVAVAFDAKGNLYALWNNVTGMPVLAVSKDGGATWGKPHNVAPPGVTATDLPAIVAGDEGRVAFAYIGSTIKEGYENKTATCTKDDPVGLSQTCKPSPNWDNATWNGYLGVITDALSDAPTVVTVTVNDAKDPIARGECGRTRCHGMYDFIDIVLDSQGRPWASFVDVCTDKCAKDPKEKDDKPLGFVGTLSTGPTLRGTPGALPPLSEMPSKAPPGHAGTQGVPVGVPTGVPASLPRGGAEWRSS